MRGPRAVLGQFDRRGDEPRARAPRLIALVVWGAFIVFPVVDAATGRGGEPRYALVLSGVVGFTALYVWVVLIWTDAAPRPRPWVLTLAQLGMAVALTVGAGNRWAFLFSYVAACAALVAPGRSPMVAVLGVGVITAVSAAIAGAGAGSAAGYAASALGVGLLLTLMRDLRSRNVELDEARAELARAAVAAERERFARDLHDLLGHSLSVIAIKAELAGRLLPGDPRRAAAEVADVETVARTALGEVRDAASGYRRPTLEGELEGARIALAAAGIIAEFERSAVVLAPEVEAVLAWAVREGSTNVIRHSGAQRCEVRICGGALEAQVEVVDDGATRTGSGGAACDAAQTAEGDAVGSGLAGLRERAATVRGRLEAGALADGGFRLSVTVPTQEGTR